MANNLNPFNTIWLLHSNNHIRFVRRCCIHDYHYDHLVIHLSEIDRQLPKKFYHHHDAGLYGINFILRPDEEYFMNIPTAIQNQIFTIEDIDYAMMSLPSGKEFPIQLYRNTEMVENRTGYVLNNTLNDHIDMILLDGPDGMVIGNGAMNRPADYSNICRKKFTLQTSYNDSSDELKIDLKHDLRSFPDFTTDVFVLDAENEEAYINKRIGFKILDGVEDITKVDSFSDPNNFVYFIPDDIVVHYKSTSSDLYCSRLPVVDYETFRRFEYQENCITISQDDWRGRGFYIKFKPGVADSVSAVRTLLKGWKMQLLFKMEKVKKVPVLLDRYRISTYQGLTNLSVPEGYAISYFYKTLPLGGI